MKRGRRLANCAVGVASALVLTHGRRHGQMCRRPPSTRQTIGTTGALMMPLLDTSVANYGQLRAAGLAMASPWCMAGAMAMCTMPAQPAPWPGVQAAAGDQTRNRYGRRPNSAATTIESMLS